MVGVIHYPVLIVDYRFSFVYFFVCFIRFSLLPFSVGFARRFTFFACNRNRFTGAPSRDRRHGNVTNRRSRCEGYSEFRHIVVGRRDLPTYITIPYLELAVRRLRVFFHLFSDCLQSISLRVAEYSLLLLLFFYCCCCIFYTVCETR